ncbi:MAG: hypothetical protein H0X51_04240 [Parachlamydiaceae bacterium]|nr:hypothetical protein [Parachlamydiaceae bacterium]
MTQTLLSSLLVLLTIGTLTGCYPMPNDDDFSVIPMTNNRDFNQEGENPLLPSTGF